MPIGAVASRLSPTWFELAGLILESGVKPKLDNGFISGASTFTAANLASLLSIVDEASAIDALTTVEIGYLSGATPGTQVASKAVVADANVNTGISKVAELHIGATGAEVQVTATPAQLNQAFYDPGAMASAAIDFTGVGGAAGNVTIDGVVYLEADAEDFPNGVWTNGASAADSATSLISAINGDTRATVPFTALADVSGDGLNLFWDAVGVAGNVTISTTCANCTVENSVDGRAAGIKRIATVSHTVTTQELLSGAIEIPIPFVPRVPSLRALKAGVPVYYTDSLSIAATPNRLILTTAGGTNLADGDVLVGTVYE